MLGKNVKDRSAPEISQPKSTPVPSHSVVGQGMTVSGDCTTEGHVRVEGTVSGSVVTNGLELTESGVVEGDVSVPEGGKKGQVFVVSGRVTGCVRAHIVDVKKSGRVLGGIDAEEATIHGTVEGGVAVRNRLAIAATAVVSGDVRTDRLVMEEGGRVNGTIRMGGEATRSSSKPGSEPVGKTDRPDSEAREEAGGSQESEDGSSGPSKTKSAAA